MKPRKRIAIVCQDEMALSLLSTVLDVRGYAPETGWCGVEDVGVRSVLLVGESFEAHERIDMEIFTARVGTSIVAVPARGVLPERLWIAIVLDRLRLATVRKRGPKLKIPAKLEAA